MIHNFNVEAIVDRRTEIGTLIASRRELDWLFTANDLPHDEFKVLLERSNMTLTPRCGPIWIFTTKQSSTCQLLYVLA